MRPTDTDALRREAERLLVEADRIDAEPRDDFALGTLITWERNWEPSDQAYTFAAIKYSESNWATTGRTASRCSWRTLWQTQLSLALPGTVYWASELTLAEWS